MAGLIIYKVTHQLKPETELAHCLTIKYKLEVKNI